MATLHDRAAELAKDDTDLGQKVARALEASMDIDAMVLATIQMFAKQILNGVGNRLHTRDRNAKFVRWVDTDKGSSAVFSIPRPGTFNDAQVTVTFQATPRFGEYEAEVTVDRKTLDIGGRVQYLGMSKMIEAMVDATYDLM